VIVYGLAVGLLVAASARAAHVTIEIDGLNEEMRESVRASLELAEYQGRDISPAELRSAYRESDQQIKRALEPFGFGRLLPRGLLREPIESLARAHVAASMCWRLSAVRPREVVIEDD